MLTLLSFTDLQQHLSITSEVLLDLKLNTLTVLYLLRQRFDSLYVCCLKASSRTVKAPHLTRSLSALLDDFWTVKRSTRQTNILSDVCEHILDLY